MRVVIDIECNSLDNPTEIWLIICKDIDTGFVSIFRGVTRDDEERERFIAYSNNVNYWIGHNIIGYDLPCLLNLINLRVDCNSCCDTLVISRLINYSREGGHSLEQYGEEFGFEKKLFLKFSDPELYDTNSLLFKKLEDYCVRDVHLSHKVYLYYERYINDSDWSSSIDLEQRFQLICNDLHDNGFAFNIEKAQKLLRSVTDQLATLDKEIKNAFPPRLKLIREIHPVYTRYGTLHRKDFRWVRDGNLSEFNGGPFSHCSWEEFNPSSHKQLIDVLTLAGWKPEGKSKAHSEALRRSSEVERLKQFAKYGWKINEENLSTLPATAPAPARLLAKRILIESRRRTLTEWIGLCGEDGRIHGKFYGIGAWTHRMAHQKPNTANIPRPLKEDGSTKLLGKELRELWRAPKNRLLVGVDAEGIQLRIFAHYIDDVEFTDALVKGKKADKSDPHSLNQRVLGSVCKSRQAAKRFVYALLLGAGLFKLSSILECSEAGCKEALDRLLYRYTGWKRLKEKDIPFDAEMGFFQGLDGRKIHIPGGTVKDRRHLCMSGYLQTGEAIVIKRAALLINEKLKEEKNLRKWMFVDIVHDELQSEVHNDMGLALRVAQIKADAIKSAGEFYNLRCPMAGSYWNDDDQDYTIGTNWYKTH